MERKREWAIKEESGDFGLHNWSSKEVWGDDVVFEVILLFESAFKSKPIN